MRIETDELTAFTGRNDAGKSSILDALGAFFQHPSCKLDPSDINIEASKGEELAIGCVFDELPQTLTLDATSQTSLASEYLLRADGLLELHQVWKITGSKSMAKPMIHVHAHHPTQEPFDNLLSLKNTDLKRLAKDCGFLEQADASSNPSLRGAIRDAAQDLALGDRQIRLDNVDGGKEIWTKLTACLPTYALFRADRPSQDGDAEVQDPLRVAIDMAIAELSEELNSIEQRVMQRAMDVARRTVDELASIDPDLAESLEPTMAKDPVWARLFSLGLSDSRGIPLNKRGSGVRRLVLLSFFRAEAARQAASAGAGVIYAVEEPETAQHPSNQVLVVEALKQLSQQDGTQVLLTTHIPALAGLLPADSIRHVVNDGRAAQVLDEDLAAVSRDLGVLPDRQRAQIVFALEGPNDINFMTHISRLLHQDSSGRVIDLERDTRVAVVPLGGGTLQHWVTKHYLRNMRVPEVHVYDRDTEPQFDPKCEHVQAQQEVNDRGDSSVAFITTKREIENYLTSEAIDEALVKAGAERLELEVSDGMDVPSEIKSRLNRKTFRRRDIKSWLCDEGAASMTVEGLRARHAYDELESWLEALSERMKDTV